MNNNNKEIKVSFAQIAEIGFVVDLHSRVYTELGYGLPIQKHIMTSLITFIDHYEQGKIWIAKINNEKIGSIGLVQEKNQWKIRWFAVDNAYQGLGVGRKLLDALMNFVIEKEIIHLQLGTIDELVAARKLYANYGFKQVSQQATNLWKEYEVVDEVWEWHAEVETDR